MQHFPRPKKPDYFDREIYSPGIQYIQSYPTATEFRPLWSRVKKCAEDLRKEFQSLCAYSVIFCDDGHVDHFISQQECCRSNHKELIYSWENYRYASPIVNQNKSRKPSTLILDPLDVRDGWFEVDLPSTLLVATTQLPVELIEKARYTLKELHLNDGKIFDRRRSLFNRFVKGDFALGYVACICPIMERAIRNRLHSIAFDPTIASCLRFEQGVATMGELEQYASHIHEQVMLQFYQ
ncbi:MAG: hypothetical protein HGA45_14780 [Chloroflexales bacterium]|nr:hypothetical protein [Chloroflexales bacterium]